MGMFGSKKQKVVEPGWTDKLEEKVTNVVRSILERALSDTETVLAKLKDSFDLEKRIADQREEIETPIEDPCAVLELHSQTPFACNFRAKIGKRTIRQKFTAADNHHPVCQRLDIVHVVGCENYSHAALAIHFFNEFADCQFRHRVKADCRFI